MNGENIDLFSSAGVEKLFGKRYLTEIIDNIRKVYLSDNRPWVIGYSGGKDSTASLQLVWSALDSLPRKNVNKPVYVISSNTLVESPAIIDLISSNLKALQRSATENSLPFFTQVVEPKISDSFWVNLLGKGYPVPYSRSRWCTDRLKIRPMNEYILSKIAQYGEVVIVLGLRKDESVTRAQAIKKHAIRRTELKSHTFFPGAYVYLPIVDFSTDDVWRYLNESPCPWGSKDTNEELFALYRDAGADERPLVMDESTPPLGNRRFGCWVCTVVNRDLSMEALIESRGISWMKHLLELRNFIASFKEQEQKEKYRDHRRRNGKVHFKKDGKSVAWGQTTIEKGLPQLILKKLLETQIEVRKCNPDVTLISNEEIHEIRRLWRIEQHDWRDQIPQIYQEVTGKDLNWIQDDMGRFTTEDRVVLEEICQNKSVPPKLVAELLDLEREFQGMSRRANIYKRIEKILKKDWRTLDDIMKS
ncbi:MAG: DNA phosphorothioation system sulfurtransferase DndC [Deltaproteobacteria bacterium]|nr:DNA phosphorothioation system sulfurtransferase DndC [Deltaproteobacteria bacterium]